MFVWNRMRYGSGDILNKQRCFEIKNGQCTEDGLFSLDARVVLCLRPAPVIMINEDVYGRLTADDSPDIIKSYKEKEAEAV